MYYHVFFTPEQFYSITGHRVGENEILVSFLWFSCVW